MARAKKSKDSDPKPESAAEEPVKAVEDAVLLAGAGEMPGGEDLQASESDNDAYGLLAPTQARAARRSIWPMFLGGAVVAAVGFLAAQYLGNDRWPFPSGRSATDELAAVVLAQNARISVLEGQISDLTQVLSYLPPGNVIDDLGARLRDGQQAVSEQSARIDLLDRRLGDLENRPIPDVAASSDAVAAYERELTAMRQMFEAELDRIEAGQETAVEIETNAAERAEIAVKRAALAPGSVKYGSWRTVRRGTDGVARRGRCGAGAPDRTFARRRCEYGRTSERISRGRACRAERRSAGRCCCRAARPVGRVSAHPAWRKIAGAAAGK